MKRFKFCIILASSVGLLALTACSGGDQIVTTQSSPPNSPSQTTSSTTSDATTSKAKEKDDHKGAEKGGQVIESGPYHLEFIPGPEADKTHLDFYLLKGDNHEAIPNAKVTAQVQLPDGSQKSLDMKYNSQDKHYTAILPGKANGEYKIAILSDINGEKVNGRFSFKP
ncbi:MAG TPA: hypothetical protein V6D19_06070 [Stenomitos sp.]